jgi:hypothetical protein
LLAQGFKSPQGHRSISGSRGDPLTTGLILSDRSGAGCERITSGGLPLGRVPVAADVARRWCVTLLKIRSSTYSPARSRSARSWLAGVPSTRSPPCRNARSARQRRTWSARSGRGHDPGAAPWAGRSKRDYPRKPCRAGEGPWPPAPTHSKPRRPGRGRRFPKLLIPSPPGSPEERGARLLRRYDQPNITRIASVWIVVHYP